MKFFLELIKHKISKILPAPKNIHSVQIYRILKKIKHSDLITDKNDSFLKDKIR